MKEDKLQEKIIDLTRQHAAEPTRNASSGHSEHLVFVKTVITISCRESTWMDHPRHRDVVVKRGSSRCCENNVSILTKKRAKDRFGQGHNILQCQMCRKRYKMEL